MKIEKTDETYGISWEIPLKSKERRRKNTFGVNTAYIGAVITLPKQLVNLISEDSTYYYIYEHFEKIVVTHEEPPREVQYKKLRLNKVSKKEDSDYFTEISTTFFNIEQIQTIKFTYYPNESDYISGEKGRIEVTTHGEAPRKHLKRVVNCESNTIDYHRYITQTHANPEIVFHEELKQILPEELYIYEVDDNLFLTSTEPEDTESTKTSEAELISQLKIMGKVDNQTEMLLFHLSLDCCDEYSGDPQVMVTARVNQ